MASSHTILNARAVVQVIYISSKSPMRLDAVQLETIDCLLASFGAKSCTSATCWDSHSPVRLQRWQAVVFGRFGSFPSRATRGAENRPLEASVWNALVGWLGCTYTALCPDILHIEYPSGHFQTSSWEKPDCKWAQASLISPSASWDWW